MYLAQIKTFVSALIVMSLLLTACSKDVDSETVAYEFVRLYFVEDDMAGAVKLTSGSAKAKLDSLLRESVAVGAKEPPKDKPLVKATLQETQPAPDGTILYIYRVTSDSPPVMGDVEVPVAEPITARLWLSKQGNAWYVSKFVQEE
jgi:hypothetical protein